jgi:hypothetical protein
MTRADQDRLRASSLHEIHAARALQSHQALWTNKNNEQERAQPWLKKLTSTTKITI